MVSAPYINFAGLILVLFQIDPAKAPVNQPRRCLSEAQFRVLDRFFINREYPNHNDWAEVSYLLEKGSYREIWKDSSGGVRKDVMQRFMPRMAPQDNCGRLVKYIVHFHLYGKPEHVRMISLIPREAGVFWVTFEPLG